MRRLSSLLLLSAATLASSGRADEVRLADGRVLVGPTRSAGGLLHVDTLDGEVAVPRDQVLTVRTTDELRAEFDGLAARAGSTAFGRLQLARTARGWGLHDEMWQMLDGAVQHAAPGDATHARLGAFLAELEPEVLPHKWRKGTTEVRVRELLYRIRPDTTPSRMAAVEELLVREPNADAVLRVRARSGSRAAQRLCAVRALARRNAEGNDRFVYRTMILDGDLKVRQGVGETLHDGRRAEAAVRYLAPGLLHPVPAVRIRTAEAYGHMRAEAAIDVLVAAGPRAGKPPADDSGGSVRGHVAFIDQTSYIRDFDVEVAQASFIADPKVDVLQSGVVLDATVHAVINYRSEIVRAYRGALKNIARSDPGSNPKKWAAWRAGLLAQK